MSIKKIGTFIASRALYFVLGVLIAVGGTYVYATWDGAKTNVAPNNNPGQLSEGNWNELVNMVENGITNASSLTTGTVLNTLLDTDLQDLADGELSGGKVGAGISGDNITNGTIDSSEIEDNTLTASDLADNACGSAELEDSPVFVNPTASTPTANNHVATKGYVDGAIIYPKQCAMTVIKPNGNLGGIAGADAKCQAEFGSDWLFATCGKFLSNAPGVSIFQAWCEDPLCNSDCQDLALGEWWHANGAGVAGYGSTIVSGITGWMEIFGGNPVDPLAICNANKHIACCNY